MRKALIAICVLVFAVSLSAQVRTGNITGKVVDPQGNPLPGVSVTLIPAAGAPVVSITTAEGTFRFVSLPPAKDYKIKAELTGFKTRTEENIIVNLGFSTNLEVRMEIGVLEEQVTVTATSPVIDSKKTAVGKQVTQEILQSLPTARDPWVVMQMAPSIIMDRENVGGNESGQQAGYVSKGDASGGGNNVWALDGVVVTDPAAIGASPIYWDFDSFQEMNIVTGGADVTMQTGGVGLNMVTRRGGNKVSFGGRFYYTDSLFQLNNLTPALQAQGVIAINKVNSIRDYGFNVGGPIVKDKFWLWFSYGSQMIDTLSIVGTPIKPTLTDYTGKLNLQLIPSNRFEATWVAGAKKFIGRSASQSQPRGYDQDAPFHFGSPIAKLQDEQTIGDNLLISAKLAYMNAAFSLVPDINPTYDKLAMYDPTLDLWSNSYSYYITARPMYDYNGYINYFNDHLFGVSHDIKLGVEYSNRQVTTDSGYPGDILNEFDLNWPTIDPLGGGNRQFIPGMNYFANYQQVNLDYGVKQLSAFAQDTITTGRLSVILGIRYDHQTPSIISSVWRGIRPDIGSTWSLFDSTSIAAIGAFFPSGVMPNVNPNYHWNNFVPRIGVTYDLFGTGKTLLKANFAMYSDFMGTGSASYLFTPLGIGSAWMSYYWLDGGVAGSPGFTGVTNGRVDSNELYMDDPVTGAPVQLIVGSTINPAISTLESNQYGYNWGGWQPGVSGLSPARYKVDANATSSHTMEFLASIEHELITDFNLGLAFTYRRYNHFSQDVPYYPDLGVDRTTAQYSVDPNLVPTSITKPDGTQVDLGTGGGRVFYLMTPGDPLTAPTDWSHHELNNNYYGYWGFDLTFNKRLSNRWMFDGSVSYMDQWRHYAAGGYLDPTQLWALQDQVWAPGLGGASGKINQYVFSHWMVKLEGLYQLPLGFDISATFNARAGHLIPHYMTIVDYGWTNPYNRSSSVYLDIFGTTKLPTFYQLNLRLEKMINLGGGKIYLMGDIFNVLNSAIINRRYDKSEGTYYLPYTDAEGVAHDARFVPYANNFVVNEILNPFIARFGVRFQF